MALSSGSRQALTMATGWAMSAMIAGTSLYYAAEIKEAARHLLGIDAGFGRSPAATTRTATSGGRTVEVRAGAQGHFFAPVEVNGRRITVMVDTGASMVALAYEDARAAGVLPSDRDFTQQVQTANGTARFAPVRLDRVQIGDIVVQDVEAAVAEPGKLRTTLLGMSFLGRLQRVDMRAGTMVLAD